MLPLLARRGNVLVVVDSSDMMTGRCTCLTRLFDFVFSGEEKKHNSTRRSNKKCSEQKRSSDSDKRI